MVSETSCWNRLSIAFAPGAAVPSPRRKGGAVELRPCPTTATDRTFGELPDDTLCDPGRTSREHFVIPVGHVLPHKELYASGASG